MTDDIAPTAHILVTLPIVSCYIERTICIPEPDELSSRKWCIFNGLQFLEVEKMASDEAEICGVKADAR